ncbi:ATP-dependent metallopeptidase FtsH/Yme1/Tma family protein, partial [uncultured Cytophaga sp.]|uniref:ATP-dependent metallopeptidase FtsH/Yme1/Tma family protein n=1 Tax=uncultured Cytophaga sp. TaxID=160238 RepID=UPI002608828D
MSMPEENNKKRKNPLPNPVQKTNYQIFLISALLLLVLGIALFSSSGDVQKIPKNKFFDMVLQHDVSKIVLVNDRMVEITINKEALDRGDYKKYKKKKKSLLSTN